MLEVNHLSVCFESEQRIQAVEDISLRLLPKEKMAIVGETGSGKSVLLLAILRLLPHNVSIQGEIRLDGEDLLQLDPQALTRIRGARISYVPQGGGASMNPLLRVGFQVGEPLMEHRAYSLKAAVAKSIELFKKLNLGREEQLAKSYPHVFSGGMRQRAMVAMGMAADAQIILADEPTKGLDDRRTALVLDSFQKLEDRSLLCVTHDLLFAKSLSEKIMVMYAAQAVEAGPTNKVLHEPLHPYTQDMLRALPEQGMQCQSGFAPAHHVYGTGCRYYARCSKATEKCRKQMPPYIAMGDRNVRCWHAY